MKALFISSHDDPQAWTEAITALMPTLDIEVWPDVTDPSAIEVALAWKPPHGVLGQFPNLKLICSLGMGVDFLFEDPTLPNQAAIVRLIDQNLIEQMSEYVCFAVLRQHRRIDQYEAFQQQKNWQPLPMADTAACRIGILGLGVIGSDTAQKLQTLGFPVQGWSRTPKSLAGVDSFHGRAGLQPFLQQTTILVCLLPLTDATTGIINTSTLMQLPQGAYIINLARGGHLVEQDLLAALASGHIAGATLDVFQHEPLPLEHPFWAHPNIRITPHIAGLTDARSAAPQIVANLQRLGAGEALLNEVDRAQSY